MLFQVSYKYWLTQHLLNIDFTHKTIELENCEFWPLDEENHEKPLTAGTRPSSLGLIQNHTAGLGCPQLSNCVSAGLEGLVAYLFTDSYSQMLTVCLERQ